MWRLVAAAGSSRLREPRPEVTSACRVLVVPADRPDPSGGEVRLAVEVLDTATDPAAVPVAVPGGGPGGDSISAQTDLPAWSTNHDIVRYDDRGTGLSEPSLDCPEFDQAVLDALGAVESTTDEYEATRAALSACRERLEASGVDLDDYDTPANTADLVDLRRALGCGQWAIVGGSYGTRVALDALRTDPDGVAAAVVLDSVNPPWSSPGRSTPSPRPATPRWPPRRSTTPPSSCSRATATGSVRTRAARSSSPPFSPTHSADRRHLRPRAAEPVRALAGRPHGRPTARQRRNGGPPVSRTG